MKNTVFEQATRAVDNKLMQIDALRPHLDAMLEISQRRIDNIQPDLMNQTAALLRTWQQVQEVENESQKTT